MWLLLLPAVVHAAEAERWPVRYLPMGEARALVKSALSPTGSVVALESLHLLVVRDDADHRKRARALLAQYDRPPNQYRVTVEIIEAMESDDEALQAAARLPGGWLRLEGQSEAIDYSGTRQWSLLLLAGREGMVTTGEVQPFRRRIRRWLAGYGLLRRESVDLVALTSGFFVRLQPGGDNQVEVALQPWLARSQPSLPADAKPELLIGLGTATAPAASPSVGSAPLRLNAAPQMEMPKPVRILHAATHLRVTPGRPVELVAARGESQRFGRTLLGASDTSGNGALHIRLLVERVDGE
ncbi:MAG: hypothetical protein D6682_07070 [Zetaproteobacteria bacterium]|nr:MAG: hypothetical protein D6682_07070 [Zetaproteobacteria bacterium]